MLQFARRRRWFLPLTVLLTVVAVQQLMLADGAQESKDAGTVGLRDEDSDSKERESYNDLEEDEDEGSQARSGSHSLSRRSKKRPSRQRFGKTGAALVPLFFAALAAAFAGAGYIIVHRGKGNLRNAIPALWRRQDKSETQGSAEETETAVDVTPGRLQSYMKIGKRFLPASAALALATLIIAAILQKYNILTPSDTPSPFANISRMFMPGT